MPCHVKADVELLSDLLIVEPLVGQQDNPGAQNNLLRGGMATHQGF
jgi:hypothetical protein